LRNFASDEGTAALCGVFACLQRWAACRHRLQHASAAPEGRADFVADPVLEEAHVTTPTEFDSIDQWQSPCLP
jgi:hypothetical protein